MITQFFLITVSLACPSSLTKPYCLIKGCLITTTVCSPPSSDSQYITWIMNVVQWCCMGSQCNSQLTKHIWLKHQIQKKLLWNSLMINWLHYLSIITRPHESLNLLALHLRVTLNPWNHTNHMSSFFYFFLFLLGSPLVSALLKLFFPGSEWIQSVLKWANITVLKSNKLLSKQTVWRFCKTQETQCGIKTTEQPVTMSTGCDHTWSYLVLTSEKDL